MELSIEQARDYYPGDDPVHGFDHVLRVLKTAERIGMEEGADLEILRAAALLHDSKGADPRAKRTNGKFTTCSARILLKPFSPIWVGCQKKLRRCSTASAVTATARKMNRRDPSRRCAFSTRTNWTCWGRLARHAPQHSLPRQTCLFTANPLRASWRTESTNRGSSTARIMSTSSNFGSCMNGCWPRLAKRLLSSAMRFCTSILSNCKPNAR